MKYAIIAAGEGSRLHDEGILTPKPLVSIGGECLVDRLLRIFRQNGADEMVVICNEYMTEVQQHLQHLNDSRLRVRIKSTASSMHSLWELREWLDDGPFILTTVDTLFNEGEFSDYVSAFQHLTAGQRTDGLMAVTDYIDDERPLYVETDEQLHITAFADTSEHPHYISGGIYALPARSFNTLAECIARGEHRMRNFQRALLADGFQLEAYPFSKIIDIDHPGDIQKGEDFIGCQRH